MDGERYFDMKDNELLDASGRTGEETEIVTEDEVGAAFAKFMPRVQGEHLAKVLFRKPVPVMIVDDETAAIVPDDWCSFYGHNFDDPSGKAAIEVAIAVCAIRKAFPDRADGMIKALVQDNCLYGPFWDEAMKRCPELLLGTAKPRKSAESPKNRGERSAGLPLKPFGIQYDTIVGGIRIVRADMGGFTAVFTCNTSLGHCTAQFYGKTAFSPDVQYVDGRLCLGYPPMVIPPGSEDDFENAWRQARDFVCGYGETVAAIISAVESGKKLEGPAPAPPAGPGGCREDDGMAF